MIDRRLSTPWLLASGLACVMLAGCAYAAASTEPPVDVSPAPASSFGLSISNATTLTVTLIVNGTTIGAFPPQTHLDPIPSAELPALPWSVEARSPSGRLVSSLSVRAGDVQATSNPNGQGSARGDAVRVDLSCGRLDLWVGPPILGPPPGTGAPGDCAP
jgi:hypothetical protein